TVRIAFDRPQVRNAFRPHTVDELYRALDHARLDTGVGVILMTGNGPSPGAGGLPSAPAATRAIRVDPAYRSRRARDPPTTGPPPAGPRGGSGPGCPATPPPPGRWPFLLLRRRPAHSGSIRLRVL